MHDADALRSKTLKLQKQTELLYAVTDNTESYVLLLDEQQRVLFANTRMAETADTPPHELVGNSLAGVIGPANVEPISDYIGQLQKDGGTQRCTRRLVMGGEQRTFQCVLVLVEQVGERHHAMLLVLQDITELQRAQQKHASLSRRLVDTLMYVVDLHDPHSAHHSSRVAEVANAIGRELQLSKADTRTLDLAASLANLGNILIPKEILTKTEALTEAEQDSLHRHVRFGAQLIEQALNQLLEEAGNKYDRHVVAALFHVDENRSHWAQWQDE
jgi:PAS domain S-box-containing protein